MNKKIDTVTAKCNRTQFYIGHLYEGIVVEAETDGEVRYHKVFDTDDDSIAQAYEAFTELIHSAMTATD